ncbi:unnamed protein product [Scytosiphon promiscuus]
MPETRQSPENLKKLTQSWREVSGMLQRCAAKENSSGLEPPDDEDGQPVAEISPLKASDVLRQTGSGLCRLAEVINDYPLLAKMFEGGLLERRLHKAMQLPSALISGEEGSRLEAVVPDDPGQATTPGPTDPTRLNGAVAATAAAAVATSSIGVRGSGILGSRVKEGGREEAARNISPPSNWIKSASLPSEEGASGRREKRGTGLDARDDEGWPRLKQASKASKESAVPTGRLEAKEAGGNGKGVVKSRRPANQDGMEMQAPAQPRLRPSFPLPCSLGFPLTPSPRRASEQAVHGMPSMFSPGVPSVGQSPHTVSAGPRMKASAAARPAEVAAGAAGGAEEERVSKVKTKGKKADGGERVKARGKNKKRAATIEVESSKRSAWCTRGEGASVVKISKMNDKCTVVSGNSEDGGRAGDAAGPTPNAGGRAGHVDGTDYGGSTRSRETTSGLRFTLDERIFRFFRAGECRENGCVARMEVHCHLGPACDCTRISSTYLWPSEVKLMSQHQAKHLGLTTRPAFGKRVMVEFSDGNFYPGTINTDGNSAMDLSHPEGRWGVLFDDYTTDRFEDGADDVMLSSRPRLKSIPEKLRDFYLKHENGSRLLIGVQVVAEGDVEAEEDGSWYDEGHSQANNTDPESSKSRGEKTKHH